MMKKLQNIAAIFAAGALLLGAASCSHDGGASLAALSEKKTEGGDTVATIVYDASAENPAFALATSSSDSVFDTVGTTFTKAEIGKVDSTSYAMKSDYPKVAEVSFTPDNFELAKCVGKDFIDTKDSKRKVKFVCYNLLSELKDNSTKLALKKDEECAFVEYSFTLSAAADVKVDVVAFNSQSSALYGKVSVLDSAGTAKATSDTGTGSKENNDASVTATSLAAGTYKVHFAWCPASDKTADNGLKSFNGGIQSVSIKATSK